MFMNSLGLLPVEPNPHVYRGKPAVGQVWCKVIGKKYVYCVINKVDMYFHRVTYTLPGGFTFYDCKIDKFKESWIFSH